MPDTPSFRAAAVMAIGSMAACAEDGSGRIGSRWLRHRGVGITLHVREADRKGADWGSYTSPVVVYESIVSFV